MARRPFSINCNLSGIGILTFKFVRKPPGWPRVETACCKPLPKASLSACATCSEERAAMDGEVGVEGAAAAEGVVAGGVVGGDDLTSSLAFCTSVLDVSAV